MPKYKVIVTRTVTEIASFEICAKTAEDAEEKIRIKLEPSGDNVTDKDEKAAHRYFDNHPAENADNSTEFEYDADEL